MFCQPRQTQPFNNGVRQNQHTDVWFYLDFQGIWAMQALFLKEWVCLFLETNMVLQ